VSYPNVSLDLWSDATMRSFIGLIVTGVDESWDLIEVTGAFKLIEQRHFAEVIKSIYDEIVHHLRIENKVYKVVADQGANVKCAFKSVLTANYELVEVEEDKHNANNKDESEIETVDCSEVSELEQLVLYDSEDDSDKEAEDIEVEFVDASNSESNGENSTQEFEDELAYLACAAHNLQLAINDAFKSPEAKSVNRVVKRAHKFVCKCRMSSILSHELKEMNKKLLKDFPVRWNSIYIMIKSYNKLTADEIKKLINNVKREERAAVTVLPTEKKLIEELEKVLSVLYYATQLFQKSKVSSSAVYPVIVYLKSELVKDKSKDESSLFTSITKSFRVALFKFITTRFGSLMYDNLFRQATFLDPIFGPTCFDSYNRNQVIDSIKTIFNKDNEKLKDQNKEKTNKKGNEFIGKMKRFSLDCTETDYDEITDYMRFVSSIQIECPLQFWKANNFRWPNLAKIAKKVLGVPATSASVERMFSIAGHIFQAKRRRMSDKLFSNLVYCKLNEQLL
jgi:hypothetical protein